MAADPPPDAFDRKGFWPAFALLLAFTAALPLRYHYLPFLDWPQHCAMASVASHLHNPSWGFDKYYVDNPWFFPYHVFRWLQVGLGRLLGDGLGFRAALLVYLLGLPLCAYALVRRLGRDRWLALASFCVVVDGNLYWGFAPYVTGVALLLAANVLTLDALQKGRAWRFALLGVLGVAIFFTHPQPLAMCALSCGVLALAALIARRASLARMLWVAVALMPSFLLLCFFLLSRGWLGAKGSSGHGSVLSTAVSFETPLTTLSQLPWTSGLRLTGLGPLYAYLAALAAAAAAALMQRRLRRADSQPARRTGWEFQIPVLFCLWTLFVFCLPTWYRGEPLAVRAPTLLVLIAPWLWPVRRPADRREVRALIPYRAVVVAAGLFSLSWAHWRFTQYQRTLAPLDRVIELLPRDSRVATMIYGNEPLGIIPLPTYVHIGGYILAARGGMASFSFNPYISWNVTRYSLTSLVWAPSGGWQLPASYCEFYDYVFVRKGAPYPGTPFAPQFKSGTRIFAEGDLELWRTNRK